MRALTAITVLSCLALLSGCASLPNGPSVRMFPPAGKPYDLFLNEDSYCRQVAEQQTGLSPRELADRNTATGALIGTAAGTGIGAALGAASGNAGAGAVIGGLSGLLIGSATGADAGRIEGHDAQRRYDSYYVHCMYAHGNRMYTPVRSYYRRRAVPVPTPVDPGYASPPDYVPLYPPPGTPPPVTSAP